MPTKSKTNRKTRNNRKTRKMKGGFWCIFEKHFGQYYNQNCRPGIIQYSNNYYYFSNFANNEYTLFCYKPHVFKHFDDLYDITPTIRIVNPVNRYGRYYMPYSFKKPPGNLNDFKDALENFIVKNGITYTKLLDTISDEAILDSDSNISIIEDSTDNNRRVKIYWQKKKKPVLLPKILRENTTQSEYDEKYKFCIQIVSLVAEISPKYSIKQDTNDNTFRRRNTVIERSVDEIIPNNDQHSLSQIARRDSMIRKRKRIINLYNELPESNALISNI
jgi:hypothetical protein